MYIITPNNKGRYVFSWGGRAGASEGRVISESEHQKGRAIPHVSYSREGHTSFPEFSNENFCDVAFQFSSVQIKFFYSNTLRSQAKRSEVSTTWNIPCSTGSGRGGPDPAFPLLFQVNPESLPNPVFSFRKNSFTKGLIFV